MCVCVCLVCLCEHICKSVFLPFSSKSQVENHSFNKANMKLQNRGVTNPPAQRQIIPAGERWERELETRMDWRMWVSFWVYELFIRMRYFKPPISCLWEMSGWRYGEEERKWISFACVLTEVTIIVLSLMHSHAHTTLPPHIISFSEQEKNPWYSSARFSIRGHGLSGCVWMHYGNFFFFGSDTSYVWSLGPFLL